MQDEVHMAFVIALDKPLKQGQTTYNYMVMQFKKETEGDVKLKVSIQLLTHSTPKKNSSRLAGSTSSRSTMVHCMISCASCSLRSLVCE
jgi:hypothetical protein